MSNSILLEYCKCCFRDCQLNLKHVSDKLQSYLVVECSKDMTLCLELRFTVNKGALTHSILQEYFEVPSVNLKTHD